MADVPNEVDFERFRNYLRVLAAIQLRMNCQAKLDASDVVQQTMLEAHRKREQFRGQSPEELAGWMRQILARNLSNMLRAYRQGKRDAGLECRIRDEVDASALSLGALLAADHSSPSQQATRHEEILRLSLALCQLPDDQRHVVILRHCQGLPIAEIRAQTGHTVDAIGGLLKRGLRNLRKHMQEETSNSG